MKHVIANEVKQSALLQEIASFASLFRNDAWTFRGCLNIM